MELGKIQKVDLRKAWNHEAIDFTNWLAKEENLNLLSDEIGIGLKLIQTEASVGSFSADILAEEENTGRKVIIENQLEPTDHSHLGQVITYASGYDAEIIIWVVKDVREEHQQAIDWLNDHTDEKINFFAIKMELWQIGNSPFAPKFQIISQPNDWAKAIKTSTNQSALSDTKLLQLDFWNKFKEYAQTNNSKLKLRKPSPLSWYAIGIEVPGSKINLSVNTKSNTVDCMFYISDDKDLYYMLEKKKTEIEKELQLKLDWFPLEGKKASIILTSKPKSYLQDTKKWEEYFNWLNTTASNFQEIFLKHIKNDHKRDRKIYSRSKVDFC